MRKDKEKKNINKELRAIRFMSRDKGFSLIEAFVAITILTISIAGPMTIANTGLKTANTAKDQVISFFLGQGAIEYVRYLRDSNNLGSSPSWTTGFSQCIDSVCQVDTIAENIVVCAGTGQCEDLKIDPTYGFYGYNPSWDDTSFNREFTLTEVAPNVEISIDVIVSWKFGTLTKSITIHESLFNWQ